MGRGSMSGVGRKAGAHWHCSWSRNEADGGCALQEVERTRVRLADAGATSALAGCASDGRFFAALDARPGACDTELQALRNQPPPPPGLSRSERGRYEERTRDYHVSSGCRRETEASIPLGGASRPRN